jgi:hypothetical protein
MTATVSPAGYRAQAERCRRLAARVLDKQIEERLLDAARMYEELAVRLEWQAGTDAVQECRPR